MRRCIVSVVALALSTSAPSNAQNPPPPQESALAGITARGRRLVEYDRAASRGTDAILAVWPRPTGISGFLARINERGTWLVEFGRLSAARDTFFILATATQRGSTDQFTAELHQSPRIGNDVELRSFRALQAAGADLSRGPRPFQGTYNSYVLPEASGGWLVYFLPAQTQPNEYPHGGDFRYAVSPDGNTVISRFQMHRSVISGSVPASAMGGFHTAIVEDQPEDSDVFLVLSRKPAKPEVVVTEHFMYDIHTDGRITWQYSTSVKKP